MKLVLRRKMFNHEATIGELEVNGKFFCYTLEDTDRKLEEGGEKIYAKTAIPRGLYQVIVNYSNRFKRELPLLLNVPQYEGVRIHPGNAPENTEGCVLVGSTIVNDKFIGNSRATFNKLFALMEAAYDKGDSISIEVI